jgi:hypothetical protein
MMTQARIPFFTRDNGNEFKAYLKKKCKCIADRNTLIKLGMNLLPEQRDRVILDLGSELSRQSDHILMKCDAILSANRERSLALLERYSANYRANNKYQPTCEEYDIDKSRLNAFKKICKKYNEFKKQIELIQENCQLIFTELQRIKSDPVRQCVDIICSEFDRNIRILNALAGNSDEVSTLQEKDGLTAKPL